MRKYTAVMYEHHHDHGDDNPPTIEPAVLLEEASIYMTGYETIEEAQAEADSFNRRL